MTGKGMKQKFASVLGMPQEVIEAWVLSQNQFVGMDAFDKIMKAYKDYPEWFPSQHAYYFVVPKEVHEAFEIEAYGPPKPEPEFIKPVGGGIIDQINHKTVTYNPDGVDFLKAFQDMIDAEEKRQKERVKEWKRVEKIWNKHYKRYEVRYDAMCPHIEIIINKPDPADSGERKTWKQ